MSGLAQTEATAKLQSVLVQRAVSVCNSGEINNAIEYIEGAIKGAAHDIQFVTLPARLTTGVAREWLLSTGVEVRNGNQLVIPSTDDPLAGCAEFAEALKDWASDLKTAKDSAGQQQQQQQQQYKTPPTVRIKRRRTEPGAPARPSKRAAAVSSGPAPHALEFDTSPDTVQNGAADGCADDGGGGEESEDESGSGSTVDSVAGSHRRRIKQLEAVEMWMAREKQYEGELETALKAVDAAENADLRALREEKANLARNNYRTAVSALKMARKEAGLAEK